MTTPTIADLVGVIYSSGKVFDGLTTGRLDTESFLLSGDTRGVASRQDLMLLQDLKSVAEFIIVNPQTLLDARYLMDINAQMVQTASIHPGVLRRQDQNIGVNTQFGRHEPGALTEAELNELVSIALQQSTEEEKAVALFVHLAKAQPFMDGNKRTGLFAANSLLINSHTQRVLTIPVDEVDPSVAMEFNDLLARAYIFGEMEPVSAMLIDQGINAINTRVKPATEEAETLEEFKSYLRQQPTPESE